MTVILITGASSGIGYQTAAQLAKQGHIVYGAARRVEKIAALGNAGVKPLKLDVTSDASVQTAVSQIISEQGRIDVLINNAGYGSYGAVEDVSITEAQKQLDVNLLGVARLTQAVLPYMRKQHSGRIINTSSMGGRMTTYFGAWYHATKYALEAFSDALRMEVSNFGIDVSIIEPGGIKTDWGFIAADHLAESAKGGAYEQYAEKTAAGMRKQYGSNLMSNPKIIANTMSKAVNASRPRTRYLIGMGAKPLVFLHTVLPTRMFDWMMMRAS
ncbi:short-chain dehydrogenase/reductase [Secundilactobacillus paracollinoides]|uniref:oxidoreductase n=1 Tax=Secundilactobacillus paracollinoides TaxID=240427 RepID=UPI0006D2B8CA|nr:oxidoreductase [Secundilactobacillus paracollinoides]ANZ64975.1 short-chain dehydrogenase/reductase [Secundilactobacillus paracollinoides]KRL78861.1 short chain dehydrogenase [Secundilactobacillus paracollinoides DSM 15502 = JCM 11969]